MGLDYGTDIGYHYVFVGMDANTDSGSIVGRFWQPGNRSGVNETGCPDSAWLVPFPPPADKFYIHEFFGSTACNNQGCPAGELIVLVQDVTTDGSGSKFTIGRVTETSGGELIWNLNRTLDDWNLVPIPRPRVTSSSRSGTNVIVDVAFDDVAAAYHENQVTGSGSDADVPNPATPHSTITKYRLMKATGTSDPGRSPAAWTLVSSVATAPGGASLTGITLDCSNTAQDVFLATQLEFDNGQLLSDYVSASTRIECDPNLAEPGRFKLIDKNKGKQGPIKPRTRR